MRKILTLFMVLILAFSFTFAKDFGAPTNRFKGTIDAASSITGQAITNLANQGAYYYADGVNDKITVTDDADITNIFHTGGSVALRGNIEALSDTDYVAAKGWSIYAVEDTLFFAVPFLGTDGLWYVTEPASGRKLAWLVDPTGGDEFSLVITYDGSDTSNVPIIYLNGRAQELTTSQIPDSTITTDSGTDLTLFVNASTGYLKGTLTNFQLFSKVLTSTDADNYDSNKPVDYAYLGASAAYIYESDFSGSADSWVATAGLIVNGGAGAQGRTSILYAQSDTSALTHYTTRAAAVYEYGKIYEIDFSFFIPGANDTVDGLYIAGESDTIPISPVYTDTSEWIDTSFIYTHTASTDGMRIYMTSNGLITFPTDSLDSIYVSEINITQIGNLINLDQNGMASATWYDQSDNGHDGTISGATVINDPPHTVKDSIEAQHIGVATITMTSTLTGATNIAMSSCTASGTQSYAGGQGSVANGNYSIASGEGSVTISRNSVASGKNSTTRLNSQYAQASGQIDSTGDAQFTRFVMNDTTASIEADTMSTPQAFVIPQGGIFACTITVNGTDSTATVAGFYKRRVYISNIAGTTSLIGTVQTIGTDIETGSVGGVTITAKDATDELVIAVTGKAATAMRWVAVIEAVEVGFF